MGFFKKTGKSIYGPEFYRDIIKQPAGFSIKYVVLLSLLFAFLVTIKFSIVALPELNSAISQIGPGIVNNFPAELAVTMKGGKVSTNVEEPYFIKLPSSWKESKDGKTPENLIVIDTKGEPSASNLEKYDTAVLLTEEYFVYEEENGKITSNSLAKVPDSVIDKNFVTNISNKYSPYLKILLPIMTVVVFFAALFYVPLRLVYLLFAALLIWLIAKMKKVPVGYGKSYQMGMHLITLPIIIVTLLPIKFVFFFTVLLVIAAVINLRKMEETGEEEILAENPVPVVNPVPIPPQENPDAGGVPPANLTINQ